MLPILLGVLGPLLGKVIDTVGSKLGVDMDSDQLKTKKVELELELQKLLQESAVGQLKVNEAEAANPNRTWLTWREALGYVCVLAVSYHFVLQPLMIFLLASAGHPIEALPDIEISGLMTILSAMIGVHFVDSRYNSEPGKMPVVPNKPKSAGGRLVFDKEAGGTIWKED